MPHSPRPGRRCRMTPEEKIEALREFFDNVDGNIEELKQGAWWDGFYWTRQKVLNITDPPRAKWREMVDAAKSVRHWLPGNELAVTLYHLSELANSPDDSHQLACIVAMCEDKVGDGWEADPDRVPVGHWGISWLLVPLSHEPPAWHVLGDRAAAWLRSLTDGGAA